MAQSTGWLGGVVGHWLWKPWRRHKRARDPWEYSPGNADELLDFERIMANNRKDEVSVSLRDARGNIVKPRLLGVILPDFTDWALPYVLVEDDGQGDRGEGDWGGLVRVTHTSKLDVWEQRLVQHLVGRPLFYKQKYSNKETVGAYRTIHVPLWQDAYACLDSLPFLCAEFRTPIGVYVASLLHGRHPSLGPLGCVHQFRCTRRKPPNVGGASCPTG